MFGNPYYNQQNKFANVQNMAMPQQNYVQPIQQPMQMPTQSIILGKIVDNIEVVKATDIPLDGSISYFPLTDGSAIVSKQLQMDGTSKIVVYKPYEEEKKETIRYATFEDLQEAISDIDLSDIQDLKDDIREIKKQLKEFKTKKVKED